MNAPTADHRSEAPIAGRLRRLRRWVGLPADPPPRSPALRRLHPVRRSWLLAVWQARAAVLARTPLDEYLRARLARYLLRLPIPRSQLPVRIEIAGGEILAAPGDAAPPPPPAGPDAWAAPLVWLEGPSILRELPELRARLASLVAQGTAAHRRVTELAERFADDVAGGKLPPVPRPEDTAEQLGRPPVRGPGAQLALLAFALAALLSQAWAIAVPALSATGHHPAILEGELRAQALEITLTCLFALGVSVGLLALALIALQSAESFAQAIGTAQRRRAQASALLAGLAAASAAAAAATLPAPRSGLPPASHAVLLLSVGGGAALVLRWARRERAARAAEVAAALAWDRGRAGALAERSRRVEELARAEAAALDLDRLRREGRARLEELEERSAAAARTLARVEEVARADRGRVAQSLLGALERDRYEFLRQASARGAADLLTGPWKPPVEPPPPAEDVPAESGRMAG